MIPKLTSSFCFSAVAESILLDIRTRPDAPTETMIYETLLETHPQISLMEVQEGILQLLGRTREHTTATLWRDAFGALGRHHLFKDTQDPYIRACIIFEVFQTAGSEEANFYRIMQNLMTTRRISTDMAFKHLKELQEEGLVLDRVAGKFILNPGVSIDVYDNMLSVIPSIRFKA